MKIIKNKLSIIIILALIFTTIISTLVVKNAFASDYAGNLTVVNNQRDYISDINEETLLRYNNIYCIEHGQWVSDRNDNKVTFTSMAKAEIEGDKVTFEKYDQYGNVSATKTYNSRLTHQIAAVLNNAGHENNSQNLGYGDGTVANQGGYYASEVQLALWYKWNTWISETGAEIYGFTKGANNEVVYSWDTQTAQQRQAAWENRVNKMEDNVTYCATIYFLENLSNNENQNLILVKTSKTRIIKITKIWNDNGNEYGFRPDSVTFQLMQGTKGDYANSTVVSEVTISRSNGNTWSGELRDVPYYGAFWLYEKPIAGYTSDVGKDWTWNQTDKKYRVTNTLETVKVSVLKVWDDYDNDDNTRPNSVKVILKKNGQRHGEAILKPSNNWKTEFVGLPKYDSSNRLINYTVEEVDVPTGYTASCSNNGNNWTIKNKHIPEVKLKIVKTWLDDYDRDGIRPESIELKVSWTGSNNQRTITLNGADYTTGKWQKVVGGFPKYTTSGEQVRFRVEEVNLPEGYQNTSVTYSQPNENNEITINVVNYHEPEKINLEVNKVWDDQEDLDEYRPNSIYVALYANGEYKESKELNVNNQWTYKWEDLYKYENGREIEYTIKERKDADRNSAENIPNYEQPVYNKEVKTEGEIDTILYTITNKHIPHYDGYIEINGKVWLDKPQGKGNDIDGKYTSESADKVLEGIKVSLKDKNGNLFDITSTAVTDANGNYTLRVNYDNSKNVYKLYENVTAVREKLKDAYVEFEYNGNLYTTVKDVSTLNYANNDEKITELAASDKSKATENSELRNNFDTAHSTTTSTTKKLDEWADKMLTASTIAMSNYDNDNCSTITKRNETIKYCNGNGTYIRTNPNGAWDNILNGQKDLATHPDHNSSEHTSEGHIMRTYEIEVQIINNINLGLFEREQPEVAIFEDISSVEVEMNGQRYKYLYNVISDRYAESPIKTKFQNKDTYTYRRPVNPADVAFIQEEANSNLLKAYVTYTVKIGNLSTTLPIKVNEIINAYDSQYTLIGVSKGHKYNETQKDGFNTINIEELQLTVQPGQESEKIELKYEISNEAIVGLLNKDATLNNAVEIINYTTYYGENTLYAEQQTGGRTNNKYGGRYDEEQPGNAGFYINEEQRIDIQNDEFDTDIAPSFVLCKDNEVNKVLSGTVWQDTDADNTDNKRLGNGKQDENAKNVKGVKVELFKIKDDGSLDIAKLYKLNTETATVDNKDAVTYTDENGNYSFGDSEYGVVTDRYVIKYTYGDGSTIGDVHISTRNYKSTIISPENETLYNVFKGTSTSEEWHLDMKQDANYSIAVDDISKLPTENLIYSNFNETMNMEVFSKPFKMQVEFDTDTENSRYEGQVGEDGKSQYGKELSVFDFGIIERPREDIFVETSIDYLKVTLANGQILTEGNPKAEKLSYVKAIGLSQNINNGLQARQALDKQAVIEIDSELIQGAKLDIRYEIKVTNNGEIDYDYTQGTEYYYFGTNNENAPVLTNSVHKLVYYMDKDLVWTVDNEKWTQKTANELFDEGLISENTKNAILDKYTAFITEQFKDIPPKDAGENVKIDYISAQKMLANSDDNKFDNQAEILEIDAKIARTIKNIDESGIPQVKDYKMGNYVPSTANRVINTDINNEIAGLHEQDDDRSTVIITPPTGVEMYIITYVIAGLIGLIVLVIGIVFIRKKVLSK